MNIGSLGGDLLGLIPLGDIVLYINPFHLFMFVTMLIFTFLIAIGRTETQVETQFGTLDDKTKTVDLKEFRARRFLSVICGIATAGAMITGDLYNLTLFMSLIGILNIGIISSVKQIDVLDSVFQYGLIAMMCSLPLFGGAALVLGACGTVSLLAIQSIKPTAMMIFGAILMFIGACGESGIAPFFASKAEMFRTPGSPFLLIVHLSSLFIIIRVIEVLLIICT